MKTSTPLIYPQKLYCFVFGHKFEETKKVTHFVKEYTCKCCKKQFTTDENGELTELTPKRREINTILTKMYANKLARMRQQNFSISTAS